MLRPRKAEKAYSAIASKASLVIMGWPAGRSSSEKSSGYNRRNGGHPKAEIESNVQ
jgi:hypothetical protein